MAFGCVLRVFNISMVRVLHHITKRGLMYNIQLYKYCTLEPFQIFFFISSPLNHSHVPKKKISSKINKWYFLNSKSHITLNKRFVLSKSSLQNWHNWLNFFLMFSIVEDWISCFKLNGSGNDFMEKLYIHVILFWYHKIQGTNENILIFQP